MKLPIGLIALLGLGTSACQFWYPEPNALHGPLPAHRAVQVWLAGKSYDLHHVTVQNDTVRGSTNWTTFDCDTCVIALPLPAVDSLKVKKVSVGATVLFSLTVLLTVAYFGLQASFGGAHS